MTEGSAVPDWGDVLSAHDGWLRRVVATRLREPQGVDEVMQEVALAVVAQRSPLLDPSRIVVTSGIRATTTSLRRWADETGAPVVVALSIGGSVRGMSWRDAIRRRWGELFPKVRFERSQADAVAAHFALAMVRLARWTTRIGVPLLVWTVDSPRLQRRFLHDRRIWMITTNHPARAVAMRDRRGR